MLKESIRTSKSVNSLTDFQFRVWTYLITYVDDFGRGSADPEILKGMVFTRRKGVTEAQIEKALAELANIGMVNLYEVDGEPFFYFPNWGDHQRMRTTKAKYPAPEDGNAICSNLPQVAASCGELPPEVEEKPKEKPKPKEKKKGTFVPPTLAEVEAYCKERGNKVNPKRFYDFFANGNWVDSKGNAVRSWKQKVITWEGYADNAPVQEPKRETTYDLDEFEALLAEGGYLHGK